MKGAGETAAERERLTGIIPAHRYGTPEDIAGAVSYLLGDDSTCLNGSVITADGAFTSVR